MTELFRRCKTCGVSKSLGDFYIHPGGKFLRCKACCIEARKEAYRRNPEYTKALVRGYREAAKAKRLAEGLHVSRGRPKSVRAPRATP